jgi:hypothetical protein
MPSTVYKDHRIILYLYHSVLIDHKKNIVMKTVNVHLILQLGGNKNVCTAVFSELIQCVADC